MFSRQLCAAMFVALALCPAYPLGAQHDRHHPPGTSARGQSDSAFRALQERGKHVMGVDQYSSSHVFEDSRDGGRIELQRDVADTTGTAVIRAHMRDVAARFAAGDFSLSETVHDDHEIPGVAEMRSFGRAIRYTYRVRPRGGEVRITTTDSRAVAAIHRFLEFQRSDHRAAEKRP